MIVHGWNDMIGSDFLQMKDKLLNRVHSLFEHLESSCKFNELVKFLRNTCTERECQ